MSRSNLAMTAAANAFPSPSSCSRDETIICSGKSMLMFKAWPGVLSISPRGRCCTPGSCAPSKYPCYGHQERGWNDNNWYDVTTIEVFIYVTWPVEYPAVAPQLAGRAWWKPDGLQRCRCPCSPQCSPDSVRRILPPLWCMNWNKSYIDGFYKNRSTLPLFPEVNKKLWHPWWHKQHSTFDTHHVNGGIILTKILVQSTNSKCIPSCRRLRPCYPISEKFTKIQTSSIHFIVGVDI